MAVYTEVTDEEARAFIGRFDLGSVLSLKGIAEGVENSNYLLVTDQGQFILTLYEKRVDRSDLPFFLGLMRHLSERGVNCPLPVADRDGNIMHEVAGRPAALFTFLAGLWPRRISSNHCAELGAAMARMHVAGADFPMVRPNALGLSAWRGLFEHCAPRADTIHPGLAEILEKEVTFLEKAWPDALPAGLVHADLFPDNVFFQNGRLTGLIDFYFACTDAFVYDVAIGLNAWCFEPDGQFNVTKARALLAQYGKIRPLTVEEIDALPIMARGSALRFHLTRLYDLLNHPEGAFVRPKDPMEYFQRLRFHQRVTGPAEYGLVTRP